jgi:hypothetical protein
MTEHYIAEAGLTHQVHQAALQVAYGHRGHLIAGSPAGRPRLSRAPVSSSATPGSGVSPSS